MSTAICGFPVAADCKELVVGQTYLVPCLEGRPVIGEPHIDNDHFNNTPEHWHVDSRFSTDPSSETAAVRVTGVSPELEPMFCVSSEGQGLGAGKRDRRRDDEPLPRLLREQGEVRQVPAQGDAGTAHDDRHGAGGAVGLLCGQHRAHLAPPGRAPIGDMAGGSAKATAAAARPACC